MSAFVIEYVAPVAGRWEGEFHAKDLMPHLPAHFTQTQVSSCLSRMARKGDLDALGEGRYRANARSAKEAEYQERFRVEHEAGLAEVIGAATAAMFSPLRDAVSHVDSLRRLADEELRAHLSEPLAEQVEAHLEEIQRVLRLFVR
jgi:hypothetical protein